MSRALCALGGGASLLASCLSLLSCAESDLTAEQSLAALRPDGPDAALQPAYSADDTVLHHDSPGGSFRIHYTERGLHAVASGDRDVDGVPDVVQAVAREYDAVLAFYATLGFAQPLGDALLADNGGDGRFDVYLLDFPNSADGSFRSEACAESMPRRCTGYMLQENDFDGRGYASEQQATRILASHELFHAIQNAYAADVSIVLSEGTAVWASERYDGTLNDFEGFVRGYLMRPERSLAQEPTGPIDAFSYGAALFFRQLEESYGRDIVRELWEQVGKGAQSWPVVLDSVLQTRYRSSLSQAFADFARWNLYTGRRSAPSVSYENGASYPELTETPVQLPFHDELVRMTPLSARYFVIELASAATLRVELASATQDLAGLETWLAVERSGAITQLSQAAGVATTALLPAAAGDRVHVTIADTRVAGDTLRTAVCISADTAMTPCSGLSFAGQDGGSTSSLNDAGVDALPGTPVSSNTAATDGISSPGDDTSGTRPATATGGPDASTAGRSAHGEGCSSAGAKGQGMSQLAYFALLLLLIARRACRYVFNVQRSLLRTAGRSEERVG